MTTHWPILILYLTTEFAQNSYHSDVGKKTHTHLNGKQAILIGKK